MGMNRYDWTYGGGGRPGWPRQGEGYGEDYRRYAAGGHTFGGGLGRPERGYGGGWGRGGTGDFGRGTYGGAYEGYGGRPGLSRQGEYYGGGGYGPGRPSRERGYDAGFARAPFIPEEAYRRHPEYDRPPERREWEAFSHDEDDELDDRDVRRLVQRRLGNDPWLDARRIQVAVRDGVVTLTGEVDDFLEARYAWDDAWETSGVHGVVNNLTVRTDEPEARPHGDVVAQSAGDRPDLEAGEGLG